MEREGGNGERLTLYISSFSLYFIPLYPFPISKIVSFCSKMLNPAFLSQVLQITLHTRDEKIILGCEKAPQVVRACHRAHVNVEKIMIQPCLAMAGQAMS